MSLPPPHDPYGPVPPKRQQNPDLKAAADSCRLLGILFVALGGVVLLMFSAGRGVGVGVPLWFRQALAIVATLVLVGPGAWYFVAARLIRRADPRATKISLVIIPLQAAFIVLGFGMVFAGRIGGLLVVPSVVGIFFLPALGAAIWHLVRARRAAGTINLTHGFVPLAPRAEAPIVGMSPPPLPQWSASVSVSPVEAHPDGNPPRR